MIIILGWTCRDNSEKNGLNKLGFYSLNTYKETLHIFIFQFKLSRIEILY